MPTRIELAPHRRFWAALPAPRRSRIAFLIGLTAVGCLSGPPGNASPATPAAGSMERQLTDLPGIARNPRFSPDGEQVVFSLATPARTELWLVQVRDGSTKQLTDTDVREAFPAWSPDGRSIAFAATRDGVTGVWSMPAAGGPARLLFARAGMSAFSPDYSPDGRLAFTAIQPDSTRTYGDVSTWVMRGDGSEARRLTTGGDTWHARWDARGEWLYYYVGQSDELRAVNAATGEDRNVDRGGYMGWMPSPAPVGDRFAFVSSPGWSVWTAPTSSTGDLVQVSRWGEARFPTFSPDGRWIAFSRSAAPRIERIELGTGTRTALGVGTGLQPTATNEFTFVSATSLPGRAMVTVDQGRRPAREVPTDAPELAEFALASSGAIATTSSGGAQAARGLDVQRPGESQARRVVDERVFEPRWCGADDAVYFMARSGEFWQVFRLDLASGAREQLTSTPSGKHITGCATDGSWLSYVTFGGTVMTGVVRREQGAWRATEQSGWSAMSLSADGRSTAYVETGTDGMRDLYLRDASGTVRRLTRDPLIESAPAFSSDGSSIAFEVREVDEDIWVAPVPRPPAPAR